MIILIAFLLIATIGTKVVPLDLGTDFEHRYQMLGFRASVSDALSRSSARDGLCGK